MSADLFKAFLASADTLWIYEDRTLVFRSKKDQLLPLMEYLAHRGEGRPPVTIFDKIVGNAAALLAVRINCREVYSPLGSELAVRTLKKYGIVYHLTKIVPYIQQADGKSMCPMEQLSLGKTPGEFYRELKARLEAGNSAKHA